MNTSTNVNQLIPIKKHAIAVVLHLYYTELFDEVRSYLDHLGSGFDLYISLPDDQTTFEASIREQYPDASILLVQNRGRDLAPFLEFLKILLPLNYETLLKIHTKKTLHREDGTTWRKDVSEKLQGSEAQVASILQAFASDKELSMLGAQDHVLDSRFYMGKNSQKVQDLLYRCGFAQSLPESFFFVASTMFWARPGIFKPLLKAGLSSDDFEEEPLPLDGSLAHALERFFGSLVEVQGKKIASIDKRGNLAEPDSFKIYPFAIPPAHLLLRTLKSVVFYRSYQEAYAVEHLRVTAPFRAAGVQVIDGGDDPELIDNADAVLFQREFPKNLPVYDQIVSRARANGKFVLYDIDDLLFDLPETHPERVQELYNDALMPMMVAMIDADLILVPTDELCKVVEGYNQNVIVLPNYLDDTILQFKAPTLKGSDQVLTIGYMGSNSHTPDLAIVASVLQELLAKYDGRLRIEVWGTPLPGELQDCQGVTWHSTPTNVYAEFVKFFQKLEFDLVIAPLSDNLFNRCKSGLKFLEYSAIGSAGVYSRLEPYEAVVTEGVDGFLAGNEFEWREKLTLLIEKPVLRQQMADAAQKTINEKWLLSQNVRSWQDIFGKLNQDIFLEDPHKPLRAHIANTVNRQLYYDRVSSDSRYSNLAEESRYLTEQLNQIHGSREWKAVMAYRQGRAKLSKAARKIRSSLGPLGKLIPARLKAQKDLLLSSGFFDTDYYLRLYPDLQSAGVDPVVHYLEFGGAEGRNPSAEFDTSWYLKHNQDVRDARINPLLHYLRFGKQEGRTILTVSDAKVLNDNKNINLRTESERRSVPERVWLAPHLKEHFSKHLKTKYKIALSHDNYLNITGGSQVIMADEQCLANRAGISYLHIYPYRRVKMLVNDETLLYLGLNLDGEYLADTEGNELITALNEVDGIHLDQLSIHHTMGFNHKILQSLLEFSGKKGVFWLHDYFSLCPSYNLLRNDKEYCGAPEINSNACRLCRHIQQRALQQPTFERLFKDNQLEIAAPSRFTYELWQSRFPMEAPVHIIPPALLKWNMPSSAHPIVGSLKIGFLGYPLEYKGWEVWLRLVNEAEDDKRYRFYHFSTQAGEESNYRRIETRVTNKNRLAMVENLRKNQIDIALLWSTVAETFSFTLHEALASGCFILTNPDSGNIQDYIRRNPERGLVLEGEDELIRLFTSGEIAEKVKNYQKDGKPQADLVFGSLEEIDL